MLILFFPIALYLLGLPNAELAAALARGKASGNDFDMVSLTQEEMASRAKDAEQVGAETRTRRTHRADSETEVAARIEGDYLPRRGKKSTLRTSSSATRC